MEKQLDKLTLRQYMCIFTEPRQKPSRHKPIGQKPPEQSPPDMRQKPPQNKKVNLTTL